MQAVQPQQFTVDSLWPPWALFEAFAAKSYAFALASGFDARLVGESKGKPKYDLKCASPGCEFVVKVRAKKKRDAYEARITGLNFRHNHGPQNFAQPDELDSEGKQVHDNLTADLQRARKDLKAKAKNEVVHLRNSADYHSTSTSNREQLGYLSYTSEQELVVWDLAESLDDNAARPFEQNVRAARQLADDDPTKSTLDGAAHPLAAPPEIRFPGLKLAAVQSVPVKEKKPRDKPEKSKRTRKEAPSKSRRKKARVDANKMQDIVVTPTGVLSPPTSPYINGFAAYANAPSSSEALQMLAESAIYIRLPATGMHGDPGGASPLTPKVSSAKRLPLLSEDRDDIAVALSPTPLSSSTPAQPQPELLTDAGPVSQEADLTWLTLASSVFAGADGSDETSPLVREAAPSPTLPGKAETPAPTAAGENALVSSPEDTPQGDQDEVKPAGRAAIANDQATSPRAALPLQQQEEQVEDDLFAGFFAEVGQLFDFAARYYDKLLKSGEKAPPLQQTTEQDGLDAFAKSLTPATADSRELAPKMFERSLALRHSLQG